MSAEDLINKCRAKILRVIAAGTATHFEGLSEAAKFAVRHGYIDAPLGRKLAKLDNAFNIVKHIDAPLVHSLIEKVRTTIDQASPSLEPTGPQVFSMASDDENIFGNIHKSSHLSMTSSDTDFPSGTAATQQVTLVKKPTKQLTNIEEKLHAIQKSIDTLQSTADAICSEMEAARNRDGSQPDSIGTGSRSVSPKRSRSPPGARLDVASTGGTQSVPWVPPHRRNLATTNTRWADDSTDTSRPPILRAAPKAVASSSTSVETRATSIRRLPSPRHVCFPLVLDSEFEDLVGQVKAIQRLPGGRDLWASTRSNFVLDPARHSKEQLLSFIEIYENTDY